MRLDRIVEEVEKRRCWHCDKLDPPKKKPAPGAKRPGARLVFNGCEINRRMHATLLRSEVDRKQVWPEQVDKKTFKCSKKS